MNKEEIWKDIKDYPNYQVSNLGNVKNKKTNKILQYVLMPNNYCRINLCHRGKKKMFYIHRLVATAFIENPNNFSYINHKDENPTNNNADNLEWCTQKYNCNYGDGIKKCKEKKYKAISQYDLEGNFIKIWKSITQIHKELKINRSNLCLCCQHKRSQAGGFIWRYVDEEKMIQQDLKIKHLQSVINKAIEYITTEQLYTNYQWGKSQYAKILKDLLEILRSKDE